MLTKLVIKKTTEEFFEVEVDVEPYLIPCIQQKELQGLIEDLQPTETSQRILEVYPKTENTEGRL